MKLSQYMALNGLKDEQFGQIIGRSAATVSRIRRGKNPPDWKTMNAILEATKGAVTAVDFQSEVGRAA